MVNHLGLALRIHVKQILQSLPELPVSDGSETPWGSHAYHSNRYILPIVFPQKLNPLTEGSVGTVVDIIA